ncbi:C40 family peptidase [Ruegeria aquimaris]|uniref:C40 family peptidase n=1 Tax=Ruegeria aquimaris TaxID=2984333 RepID=A0ABT3AFM3_9RHOB|nr:C40 family peptidase [Ruegeria sp. XHP0148]MCV2887357.1 C40 family peptidase [Ruegeria sp. XHP0148]
MSGRAVIRPIVDLLRRPDGPRDRQVLLGERVEVLEVSEGWVRIRAAKDGYEGWVPATALGEDTEPTHWVSAPSTHAYTEADLKSPDRMAISFGSRVAVRAVTGRFAETAHGHIPVQHLMQVGERMTDPVAVAELFLGTPYLWGGDSRWGIDCSGLVQAALLACGIDCPGDSGPQSRAVGGLLPAGTPPERGDLLFWTGHVALVADAGWILHANGKDMAVAYEPLADGIARIAAQGEGPVTAHRRPAIAA